MAVSGSAAAPRVGGYYPSWTGMQPSQIRYENFSHLFHAFLVSDPLGNVNVTPGIPSRELCNLAHAKGTKVILSLGGANSGETFSSIMKDPKAVERYVAETAALVKTFGYDGIDLDWEHPQNAEDRANLVLLTGRFRKALQPGALITMAVGGTDWSGKWIDEKGLLPLVDFLNIMCYDMHGPWSDHAGYNAALDPALNDPPHGKTLSYGNYMDYWTKTKSWPKDKLNVGIPCYGYGYAVAAWGQKQKGKSQYSEGVSYKDIPVLVGQGWKRVWDPSAKVPALVKPGGGEMISYDDPESVGLKAAWSRAQGFKGIFFWEITQDMVGGDNALVVAARKAFLGADKH